MRWNLSLVHAAGPAATVEGFALANGYRPEHEAGPQPTFQELILGAGDPDGARPVLGITEIGAGVLVAARLIISHDWCAALSERNGAATWAVWQGDSSTYGFAHYQDGRLVREIQRRELETTYEDGAPLSQEALLRRADPAREPDDEADLFALVDAVTGLPPLPRWLEATARTYQPIPIIDLEPPKKKRRFGR